MWRDYNAGAWEYKCGVGRPACSRKGFRCAGRTADELLRSRAMRRSDFTFDLPPELIAQVPSAVRSDSRMLHLDGATGAVHDGMVRDLPAMLRAGDLLVYNDTRVVPARLRGHKASGGAVEVLMERVTGGDEIIAHVRASKAPATGTRLSLAGGAIEAETLGREGDLFRLRLRAHDDPRAAPLALLQRYGSVPLPPYIRRGADARDSERYQTVFARRPGAAAAPTAGLHFDAALLDRLKQAGVASAFVTLHVGAGTFQPVRVEHIADHVMHAEWLEVPDAVCDQITCVRERGGRVIAVGTTVVRSLESAARDGRLVPFSGESRLFIYPGYRFRVVDAMLTNFHLPESTLLMLVCAFAGREQVLAAYCHAVAARYRFFSYGDAMFIEPDPQARSARDAL